MRNIVFSVFIFLVVGLSPVFAAIPAPTPIPIANTVTSGMSVPGVTCGVAGDTDVTKTKCCVQKKQDTSAVNTIGDVGSALPFIGGYFSGFKNNFNAINSLSDKAEPCMFGVASTPTNSADPNCICIKGVSGNAISIFGEFCDRYMSQSPNPTEKLKCMQCMETAGGFYTAFGCIPLDISTFITSYILTTGIGIAGGIALLCILYSAFRMQTSMGNAEAIKKAQENLTACITGLIIIIFSVLILKIIGVDILRIPGITP